jgi:hypothetical protein
MTIHENGRPGPRSDQERSYLRRDEGERVRSLRGNYSADPFDIPKEWLDRYPNLSFEWKNYEIFGKPDHQQRNFEERQGWRACPYSMFPGLYAPVGEPGLIIVKDMILMERPAHLTQEARQEEIDRARYNQRANQQRAAATPPGQAPRLSPQFGSQVVPLEIPDE